LSSSERQRFSRQSLKDRIVIRPLCQVDGAKLRIKKSPLKETFNGWGTSGNLVGNLPLFSPLGGNLAVLVGNFGKVGGKLLTAGDNQRHLILSL